MLIGHCSSTVFLILPFALQPRPCIPAPEVGAAHDLAVKAETDTCNPSVRVNERHHLDAQLGEPLDQLRRRRAVADRSVDALLQPDAGADLARALEPLHLASAQRAPHRLAARLDFGESELACELLRQFLVPPVVLRVALDRAVVADPRFEQMHFVVVMMFVADGDVDSVRGVELDEPLDEAALRVGCHLIFSSRADRAVLDVDLALGLQPRERGELGGEFL